MLRATEASQWEVARPIADIELPRSVQGLIAARLDGLPEDEKAVLQDAAVVGRVFWLGALAELTGRPMAEVRDALGRLRVKELVVPHEPSSFRDEFEFAFRHGLIRDGAYDSLPKSLRADKHLGVAKWAADRAGDRADEIAELIATHEIEALGYLDELGERRPEVVRERVRSRWAAARRTIGPEPGRGEHALVPGGGAARPIGWRSRWRSAVDWSARARDRIVEPGQRRRERTRRSTRCRSLQRARDDRGVGWADAHLVLPLMQQSRHDEAEQAGRAAVQILEPLGDSEELADALHQLGLVPVAARTRAGSRTPAAPCDRHRRPR